MNTSDYLEETRIWFWEEQRKISERTRKEASKLKDVPTKGKEIDTKDTKVKK